MKNILILGNELELAKIVKVYLKSNGYKVHSTKNIKKSIQLLKKYIVQLVIIDALSLNISSLEVCKLLRKSSDVYIYVYCESIEEGIECLKAGADDYFLKPINEREIIGKVNALYRRLNSGYENALSLNDGKLKIYHEKRKVVLENKEINLTPNEFDILSILALNRGKAFSREELISKIFGHDYEGFDRVIDVHIKNLRKKIEEDSKKPRYIKTINRVGYKFEESEY
ncbi:response regulator transcription factor [Haloimpatiens sp. FM7315]|uniref:response regulator transcription factor n=1 Tax=Haloimpatiens sp. FM7315 TaxID=3298609 RepID=UPI003709C977